MISPSLQEKVSILIFSIYIQKNSRFNAVFLEKQKTLQNNMGISINIQEIVAQMISKFKTELREPEDVVVQQFDDTDQMFIIAKGACEVSIIDEKKNVEKLKVLRPGDYFGEIALIYGSKRSATVTSTKYSTLAMLVKESYKDILIEFPDLQQQLKKHIFTYNDRIKRFQKESIQKVEYFKDIGDDAVHDIIYNLKGRKFHKGDIL